MRRCDRTKDLAPQPNGTAILADSFEGFATGVRDRVAEDSPTCLSESIRTFVFGLKEMLWVCRFRFSLLFFNNTMIT